MSRQKVRLDYLVLHREGKKVIKGEEGAEMDPGKLAVEELKILDSLNFHLALNSTDELATEEECRGAASTVSDLYINFRRIHVALRNELGDSEYDKAYPDVSIKNDEVMIYLKAVKSLLRDKSSDKVKSKIDDQFQNLIFESESLAQKVVRYNDSINSDVFCVHDESICDKYISKMDGFMNEFYSLSTKMRCLCPKRFESDFRDLFERDILEIEKDILLATNLKRGLSGFRRSFSKREDLKKSQSDALVSAESLKTEISFRFMSLSKKLDLDLDDLGDYQILEVNQDKSLDTEFNSILEKVTELSSLAGIGGPGVEQMVKSVSKTRTRLVLKKDTFFEKLRKIVLERDITAEKLKNGADMLLELPKFSGYDCEMDFFTFKSQFRKLVEERVSKKHLADYLKHNYLSGQALLIVKKETDYSKIWDRLSESFGNARILLQNKLALIDGFGSLSNIKAKEKLVTTLASIINVMRDLSTLAREHEIEGQLYEGGALEKLLFIIGEARHKKFRAETLGHPLTKIQQWQKLKVFLEKELQLNEMLLLDRKTAQSMGILASRKSDSSKSGSHGNGSAHTSLVSDDPCHICDEVGHTQITTARGKLILPYYVCEEFVKMSPGKRHARLVSKNLCTVCIYPGAVKGPNHKCFFTNFCCPSHDKNNKIHVLLCETHKKNLVNLELLEKFKERFLNKCKVTLPKFVDSLALFSCTVSVNSSKIGTNSNQVGKFTGIPDVTDPPIFELQTIFISGTDEDGRPATITLNLFFDNGASDCIIRKSAIQKLLRIGRAEKVSSDPFSLSGVADHVTICKDGFWRIILPLHSGENAILSGLCLPKITSEFPTYTLTDVVQDVRGRIEGIGRTEISSAMPNFPTSVGGGTDILLGSRYKRYFPKEVYEFEDGLSILESVFLGVDGARGVFNGTHKGFAPASGTHFTSAAAYFTSAVNDYHRMRLENSPPLEVKPAPPNYDMADSFCCENGDPDMSSMPVNFCGNLSLCMATKRTPKNVKQFEEIEAAGSEVTYRCVDCRGCKKCLRGPISESLSIQEEYEQSLIEKCVNVDIELGITVAKLPFILDPDTHLVDNEHVALRVFRSQLKILNDRPDDKKSVLLFERKLQDMGCVDYVANLDASQRDLIHGDHIARYFIPWRPAWSDSPTTPCRLVFDASMSAKGGCSLNSLLAKGCNSLNNLQGIVIRWMVRKHAFHTDVQKMYNKVLLDPSHWRYQLYLFSPNLDPDAAPEWKAIKTVIYGVRPSGGLAESGLRKTVELSVDKYPLAYGPVMEDTYMDDCASGTESSDQSARVMDEIECAVSTGGFSLKGFTVSGEDPLEHLSTDGESVTVLGLKWFPKGDFLKLNIGDLNFARKLRGRKQPDNVGVIPEKLTLRQCVSRSSEVYDPAGRVAAVLAGLKLDISTLHKRCVGWDDPIPSELKEIWLRNFNLISELADVKFNRAVVPSDAVSLDLETIDTADAGEHLVCSAVYVRFLRKDGTHSCQLIFARSKIIHDITTPRAELIAAVLNASTGHIVRTSLNKFHKTSWHVTDSQVALMWINSTKAALKPFVRNRTIEVNRLTKTENWYHTKRENMIADLGTHRGVKVEQVSPGSPWIDGLPWMRDREENFPFQTVKDIVLSSKEQVDLNKEKLVCEELTPQALGAYTSVPNEVGDRYRFSRYLVNPCRFRFRKVLQIVALVFLFLRKVGAKVAARRKRAFGFLETEAKEDKFTCVVNEVTVCNATKVVVVPLTDNVHSAAKNYYFRKATSEILKFVDPKRYSKISTMKDGILYFSSRILFTQKVDGHLSFTDAVLDLTEASFFVPLVDSHSPIAYALVLETHWYDPDVSHSGVESTLRYAQNTAHIIGGRELVKKVRKGCTKCRILHRQGLKIAMGPVPDESLKIAPVFYYCQTDICGPFKAYSPANKRATLKVHFVVFCCSVTGAVDCRVMEDYTTDSFVLAFSRFSCRFGYPKMMMPDEGSQLVKACQDMVLSFSDLSHKLSTEYGVEFKTCPVGAHYVHGKVERKIQEIKRSLEKTLHTARRSILQWETLGQQVSNSINNLPIGLGNKVEDLETLDVLTPNRLILGRNNCRGPVTPLSITNDFRGIIQSNNTIYGSWFREWLISYVPTLVRQPKWFESERNIRVGDVVLFTKSDKEFERVYQYGIVFTTFESKDGLIRVVEVQYHNSNESCKRTTKRCVRELIVIHPVDELGIQAELDDFASKFD